MGSRAAMAPQEAAGRASRVEGPDEAEEAVGSWPAGEDGGVGRSGGPRWSRAE